MQKLVSIFSLILLCSVLAFGQATVTIPFSGTDGTTTIALAVGLDGTATNCIDPSLGESDLPPFPPAGVFDIRFDLAPYGCPTLSTFFDYRFASFPYSGTIQHMLWWQVSTPGVSSIELTYNLPSGQSFTIVDNITGTLLNLGPFFGSGVAIIPASYTAFGTKAYLNMIYVDVVPVELTSFTSAVSQDGVLLNWTTATELNNQGFEIERSSLVQTWEKIGYVPGNGTTTEPKAYSFMDNNISTGTYYYRLKQIDFGGQFTYSNEIEVLVDLTPQNFELFQNYPNPFNPTTTINFQVKEASDVTIVIYNMLGQEVKSLFAENVQAGNYSVDWNGVNNAGLKMSSGSYIYRMTAGDFIDAKEMILLK